MAEDRAPDPAGRAREEAAGQAVWLAAMAIAIPLLAWIERQASSPDSWQRVKMRAAKVVEKFAATTAANWWKVAERARLAYEAERHP
jgi:hypothetical protein